MSFKTATLTIAIGMTIAASIASAGCRSTFNDQNIGISGQEQYPSGYCFFFGTQQDFDTWGTEACGGYPTVYVPVYTIYNDAIVTVGRNDAGQITLLQNVMRDGNILVLDYADPSGGDTVLEGQWVASASVMICH